MNADRTHRFQGMMVAAYLWLRKPLLGVLIVMVVATQAACVAPVNNHQAALQQAKMLHPYQSNRYQPVSVTEVAAQGFVALHAYLPIGTRLKIVNPQTQYEIIVVVSGKPTARQASAMALSHVAARKLGLNPRRSHQVLYRVLPKKSPYKHTINEQYQRPLQSIKQPDILSSVLTPLSPKVVNTYLGKASYYAHKFHGRTTANGETYDMHAMTCAHKSLPFNTKVRVTNRNNGRSIVLRVNDRGPFKKGRIVDVSYGAAKKLGMIQRGIVPVKVEVLLEDTGTRV